VRTSTGEPLLLTGLSFRHWPENWSEEKKVWARREWLLGQLPKPMTFEIDDLRVMETAAGKNCEQMIGVMKLPLAIVGPLSFKGKQEEVMVPLATTEGALVASVQRGTKAIALSGGVATFVDSVGTTRSLLFVADSVKHGRDVSGWIEKTKEKFNQLAHTSSNHLTLLDATTEVVGRNLFVKLTFDTDEAMGMNMVTLAAELIAREIEKENQISCISLSANACVDKKPAWSNFIKGRGNKVQAELIVSREHTKQILKTTPEKIVEVVLRKNWLGSMISGSMGFNAHYANMAAAFFLATGQDMAHVVEASLGITTAEVVGEDLYFSILMPDVMVGVVGGGTQLPHQQNFLKMMGVAANDKGKQKLAEILGGTVLAGELSLVAALASNDLARAHATLGRKK